MRHSALFLVLACFVVLASPRTADAFHGHGGWGYGGWGYGGCGSGGGYGGYYGGYYGRGYYSGSYYGGPYWSGMGYGPSYYAYGPSYSYPAGPPYSQSYSAAPPYTPSGTSYPAYSNGQVRPASYSTAVPAATVDIVIQDDSFQPATLNVQPGSIVRWTNRGTQNHTVSSQDGRWDSGEIAPGATYTARVQYDGTYTYYCKDHAAIQGNFIVGAAATAPPSAALPAAAPPSAAPPAAPPPAAAPPAAAPPSAAPPAAEPPGALPGNPNLEARSPSPAPPSNY